MAFANEWASKGVNVNAIAPGYVATDNTRALQDDPERSVAILGRIPAGRWGKPEDFAGPAVFLASDAANYVHGATLLVDTVRPDFLKGASVDYVENLGGAHFEVTNPNAAAGCGCGAAF